jgi:hypothetical protein
MRIISSIVMSLLVALPAFAQDEEVQQEEFAPTEEEVTGEAEAAPSSPAAEAETPSSPAAEGGVGDPSVEPAESADGSPTPPSAAGDDGSAEASAEGSPTPPSAAGDDGSVTTSTVRTGKTAKLGAYRLRIGGAKPDFDDGMKFYDQLYGDTKWYPTLATDWYLFDWYATIGLTFRGGYYTADGYTAQQINKDPADIVEEDVKKNYDGPTTLTLIPLQAGISISFAPLARKWLVLDGWIGMERMYWQEVRTVKEEKVAAGTTTGAMMLQEATEEEAEDDTLTNRGWKNSSVLGASANILLNWLDGETANSMRGTMGFGFVYLTPFMEIVRTTSKEGVSFGRSVVGVGFTFESVN